MSNIVRPSYMSGTLSSMHLSAVFSLRKSKSDPCSKKNFRNAILRATSIAVDPLSEKYALEAQPATKKGKRGSILGLLRSNKTLKRYLL